MTASEIAEIIIERDRLRAELVVRTAQLKAAKKTIENTRAELGMVLERNVKIEKCFRRLAQLTLNHSVIRGAAYVTADKLGEILEQVHPEWWKGVNPNE